jgi:hypothetical protein
LVLLLLVLLFRTGSRAYRRMEPGTDRTLVLLAMLGQVTYWVHGVLNNFLDLDKGAVLVWMSAAVIAWADRAAARD